MKHLLNFGNAYCCAAGNPDTQRVAVGTRWKVVVAASYTQAVCSIEPITTPKNMARWFKIGTPFPNITCHIK
ncbi:MAG: hypothetical protein NZ820_08520 [Dehalococcoidia bacterium]|nr:hypothetical protein [Dehalococcoidia bacterium]